MKGKQFEFHSLQTSWYIQWGYGLLYVYFLQWGWSTLRFWEILSKRLIQWSLMEWYCSLLQLFGQWISLPVKFHTINALVGKIGNWPLSPCNCPLSHCSIHNASVVPSPNATRLSLPIRLCQTSVCTSQFSRPWPFIQISNWSLDHRMCWCHVQSKGNIAIRPSHTKKICIFRWFFWLKLVVWPGVHDLYQKMSAWNSREIALNTLNTSFPAWNCVKFREIIFEGFLMNSWIQILSEISR